MIATEVMRKALEALKHSRSVLNHRDLALECVPVNAAITALRAEIERLEAVEPVACQACGGPATHNAEEDRTGLPGPYCNDCDPPTAAPIAPSIPALTDDEAAAAFVAAFAAKTAARLPSFDVWANGARWAYDLAAKRAQAMVLGG